MLQALYFCKPFRDKVLEYKARNKGKSGGQAKETLLTCLADLFHSIATQKKKVGTLAPKKFITRYVIVDSWNIFTNIRNRFADLTFELGGEIEIFQLTCRAFLPDSSKL